MSRQAETEVSLVLEGAEHRGTLAVPANTPGIVLFAHGSGSSRLSSRNRFVAQALNRRGIATLLFDLLTAREDQVYETRFNIELLTRRLVGATRWIAAQPPTRDMALGYFGASTGAAAALYAAAELGEMVRAVVSRGGRPDLAMEALARVIAPTLLIVGGLDEVVLDLNRAAYARLACEKAIEVIPGATHLFEEPGTLEQVARLAADWFAQRLAIAPATT